MLRTGISYNSIKNMFLTLQKMKLKVATGYGVSKSSYAADSTMIPIQGIGQGNGAGPSGWAVISSPLFETLWSAGFATDFISCLSHTLVSLVGYGSVDDTDLLFTADCEENLIPTAQEGLNLWESNLRATGGAINAGKTFWYGIGVLWDGEKWRHKMQKELQGELTIKNFDNTTSVIKRADPDWAKKTLGFFISRQ